MELDSIYKIIDEYSEPAFQACKNALYNVLDYKVLRPEDIRTVDLKEKLTEFLFKYMNPDSADYAFRFATFAEQLLPFHIIAGSQRVSKYADRSKELLSEMKTGLAPLTVVENFLVIFISHFRSYLEANSEKEERPITITEANYYLIPEDIKTIEFIHNNIHILKVEQKKNILKRQPSTYFKRMAQTDASFLYVISVLIFYRILQFEGEI